MYSINKFIRRDKNMNTLVIFYSYSGKTKKIAEELAVKQSADLIEVKDLKSFGKFKAYTSGCFAAMKGRAWAIEPSNVDYSKYERIFMLAPVWANNPPPAFNTLLDNLPENKTIILKMISASGKSNCKERLESLIKAKGSIPESFEDIKT